MLDIGCFFVILGELKIEMLMKEDVFIIVLLFVILWMVFLWREFLEIL